MLTVDLNADVGEGYPNDAELMNYVTSVNIACGYHAGDARTMRETAGLAFAKNVAIGAHPGHRDLEGFGRLPVSLSPDEVFDIVVDQVRALKDICEAAGAKLHHVKPHGALYNQAAKDKELAAGIAKAVAAIDGGLIVYGLSGSFLISEAEAVGLRTASEVFADRTYREDGSLTPRTESNALIGDLGQSISQVRQMITMKTVTATNGNTIPIAAHTLCIHGDGEHAVEFAKAIRDTLEAERIEVRAFQHGCQ